MYTVITIEQVKAYRKKIDHLRFVHKWNMPKEQSPQDKKVLDILNTILWRSLPVVYDDFNEKWNSDAKVKNAKKKQKQRVFARLKSMESMYNGLLFITLTFRNDVLADTSDKTRKKYVERFLNGARDYVGNVDFGKENGREHYHAVTDDNDVIRNQKWEYGFFSIKPIQTGRSDRIKVGKYISKVANHAGKETSGKALFARHGKSQEVDKLPF